MALTTERILEIKAELENHLPLSLEDREELCGMALERSLQETPAEEASTVKKPRLKKEPTPEVQA